MIAASFRSLLLLASVWGALALTAWISGTLPEFSAGARPSEAMRAELNEPEPEPAEPDAEAEDPSPAVALPVPVAEATITTHSYRVCTRSEGSLRSLDVVGDARSELLLACGGELLLLGRRADGSAVRVAQVRAPGLDQPLAGATAVLDLDGDGARDLLVAFEERAESARASGVLAIIPGDGRGAFDEPRVLAPLVVRGLAVGEYDDAPGDDLAVLHWADAFGRRPSELWVFTGGASPERRVRQPFAGNPIGLSWRGNRFAVLSERGLLRFEGHGEPGLSAVPSEPTEDEVPDGETGEDGDHEGEPGAGPGDAPEDDAPGNDAPQVPENVAPVAPAPLFLVGTDAVSLGDSLERMQVGEALAVREGPLDGERRIAVLRRSRIEVGPARTPFEAVHSIPLPEGALGVDLAWDEAGIHVLFARADGLELAHWDGAEDVRIEGETGDVPTAPLALELIVR